MSNRSTLDSCFTSAFLRRLAGDWKLWVFAAGRVNAAPQVAQDDPTEAVKNHGWELQRAKQGANTAHRKRIYIFFLIYLLFIIICDIIYVILYIIVCVWKDIACRLTSWEDHLEHLSDIHANARPCCVLFVLVLFCDEFPYQRPCWWYILSYLGCKLNIHWDDLWKGHCPTDAYGKKVIKLVDWRVESALKHDQCGSKWKKFSFYSAHFCPNETMGSSIVPFKKMVAMTWLPWFQKFIQFDEHICQLGWNYQLDDFHCIAYAIFF